jgi:hypothetical protein
MNKYDNITEVLKDYIGYLLNGVSIPIILQKAKL